MLLLSSFQLLKKGSRLGLSNKKKTNNHDLMTEKIWGIKKKTATHPHPTFQSTQQVLAWIP